MATALILGIAVLCALKGEGFFRVESAPELLPFLWKERACFEAEALSGFSPKRQGEMFWLSLERAALSCGGDTAACVGNPGVCGGPAARAWTVLPRPVRAAAYLDEDDPRTALLLPGVRVRLEGRLRLARVARNPGEFDERAFLETRGAAYVFSGRVAAVESGVPLRAALAAAAAAMHRSIRRYLGGRFPPETAQLLEGLLLGYKGPLAPSTNRAVQDAGVLHLLVPSGAKVVIVLGWALLLCAEAGLSRPLRWALAAALGGFYVLAVGAQAPYVRAYLCFLAVAAGGLARRESGVLQAVVLSGSAILAFCPRELFTAGFQMTYAAVLGIHLAGTRLRLARSWPRALRLCARAVAAAAVVQASLWPLFAAYFGRGSLVAVLANPVLIPAAGPWTACGFLAWGLDAAGLHPLSEPFAYASAAGARAFLACCRFFASWPWAAVELSPMPAAEVGAYYAALCSVLVLPRWKSSAFLAVLAAGLFFAQRVREDGRLLRLTFFSQPGARAALLRLPDGGAVLLDGRVRPSFLKAALRAQGLARADETWLRRDASFGRNSGRLLPLLGRVRRLNPGERFERAGVRVETLAPASGELATLRLSHGTLELELSEDWARGREAGRGGGTREDFCIMISPSGFASSRCEAERILSIRREGAVTILSDGAHVRLEKKGS